MTVNVDQSTPMMLTADPGSIIVGNPSIADVSLNGRQLIIHGHTYGETNLIVFDGTGNKLVDFDLTVVHNTSNQLTMFVGNATSGTHRYSYSCAPNSSCEVNMMVGDDSGWMEKVIGDNRAKNDYATGVKTSDLQSKTTSVTLSASPQ
ncbi:MAG: pilus assembly protein N-terminal domain-containing protein [Alphaproteobacteria bacterium]|nr:pilus assembly protein N-terminal domain-containing protein [Alphaproteobacteria bacterium]